MPLDVFMDYLLLRAAADVGVAFCLAQCWVGQSRLFMAFFLLSSTCTLVCLLPYYLQILNPDQKGTDLRTGSNRS